MSPDAKRMWNWLAPQLDEMGILAKVDGPLLVRYCETWAKWKRSTQFLSQYNDTYIVKDSQGQPRLFLPFPQCGFFTRLSHTLSRMEQELGMSPSSRSRIQVEAIKEKPRGYRILEKYGLAGGGPKPPGWRPPGYVEPPPSISPEELEEVERTVAERSGQGSEIDRFGPRKIRTKIPPNAMTVYPELPGKKGKRNG